KVINLDGGGGLVVHGVAGAGTTLRLYDSRLPDTAVVETNIRSYNAKRGSPCQVLALSFEQWAPDLRRRSSGVNRSVRYTAERRWGNLREPRLSIGAAQVRVQQIRRLILAARHQVAVAIEGDADPAVTYVGAECFS